MYTYIHTHTCIKGRKQINFHVLQYCRLIETSVDDGSRTKDYGRRFFPSVAIKVLTMSF